MTSLTESIEPSKPTRNKAKAAVRVSKTAFVLKLLARSKGATIVDLAAATGWQSHSVRALLSGFRKKGVVLIRDARKSGENCYRIAAAKPKDKAGLASDAHTPDSATALVAPAIAIEAV